jgi:hypothetical protein
MTKHKALIALKDQARDLQSGTAHKLNFAAGGIKNIGNILFSHESGSITGLTPVDIQGLCLAVECLGDYLEGLSSDLDLEASRMLARVDELEVKQ